MLNNSNNNLINLQIVMNKVLYWYSF